MITLSYLTTTLTLPDDLLWSDRFDWQSVEQVKAYTLTGALILESGAKQTGRPITLQPEDQSAAWCPLSLLETLRAWADVAGREMVLTINGNAYDVVFRHEDGAISATPVVHFNSDAPGDFWLVTLRFTEIS